MLLGIGIASTVKSLKQKEFGFEVSDTGCVANFGCYSNKPLPFQLYFTQVQMFAALFLLFSLSCSLTVITCLQFKMRRPYGVFLFCVYLLFLVIVILAEVRVFDISLPGVLRSPAE